MSPKKIALVTGGARRLGAILATDLAQHGWDLWIHCHQSRTEAEELARKLGALGRQARVVQADLGAPGGAQALAAAVGSAPPSLVVHSASVWLSDHWLTADAADWESSHRLHSWTTVVLARLLAGREGSHLITLLDARSRDRDSGHFSYAFAKREMALLTRFLAVEAAPTVRVNGLALGLVLPPDGTSAREWMALAQRSTPLARPSSTRQVVTALRYLLANDSITGQVLTLDSGRHLKGDLFGSI